MAKRQKHTTTDEDVYLSWEDKEKLEALPEIEREKILYERYIEKVRENERKELEHRVKVLGEESESDSCSRETKDLSFPRKNSFQGTYDVFRTVVLKRDIISKIVYRKIIEKLKGLFVKIRLPTGYAVYKILKVYDGDKYEIGGLITNKWMVLGRSADRKEVCIQSISNAPVTEEEYIKYKKENEVPGDKECIRMWKKLEKEIEMDLSEEDLDYTLSQRRRFLPQEKTLTRRKIELKSLLAQAKNENNKEEIRKIEQELREINKN
ncbi:hypothetical protein NECID01_2016 [Nematocida sp. AWRm77]|nr:hypothetical protein NECID01_2016 [Nematocida sp. AWRm77]